MSNRRWVNLPAPLTLDELYTTLAAIPNARISGIPRYDFGNLMADKKLRKETYGDSVALRDCEDYFWVGEYDTILVVTGQKNEPIPIDGDILLGDLERLANHFNGYPKPYSKDDFVTYRVIFVDGTWTLEDAPDVNLIDATWRLGNMANCELLEAEKSYVAKFYTPGVFEVFEIV